MSPALRQFVWQLPRDDLQLILRVNAQKTSDNCSVLRKRVKNCYERGCMPRCPACRTGVLGQRVDYLRCQGRTPDEQTCGAQFGFDGRPWQCEAPQKTPSLRFQDLIWPDKLQAKLHLLRAGKQQDE
jgi:hypothetical protein